MGRINNGNWVNQHRKIQGKFQNKQDIAAYLFDKKLRNGNNIQENNRLNIDDFPNIPALLADEPSLSRQSIIEPIDGGKAHTPATQDFLSVLTTLSVISPNITASSKKYISTDSQNSLSSAVKSFTEMSNTSPVLFDTTAVTIPTSQHHSKSKAPIKHNDNQSLIRVKREQNSVCDLRYPDHDLYAGRKTGYDLTDDYLYVYNFWSLDTEAVRQKLQEKSNITELHLTHLKHIDSQTAQDLATILKNSNINILWLEAIDIKSSQELIAVLKYTNINVLQLGWRNSLSRESSKLFEKQLKFLSTKNSKYTLEVIKGLKDTNVEELILLNGHMGDQNVTKIIKSLKEDGAKVKILNLINNNISNKGAEDIASELRDTKITEVCLEKNQDIKSETLQKIAMILEDNRHVHKESYTSKMESSTTKEESPYDIFGKQEKKEELTTPKKNLAEKSESKAEDIVTDSPTPTPKESNPNNSASSTMSIGEVVGLTALAVSIIGAIGSTIVYVIKKFCSEKSDCTFTHDSSALSELRLDNHLDKNQGIYLTGVSVDEDIAKLL